MNGLASLTAACTAFVGSHFLLSHPLRARLVERLGETPFRGLYSLVTLATFGWIIWAYMRAPPETPHWGGSDKVWIAATVVMWFASVLLAGSLVGNPALPDPRAQVHATKPAQGVFAITRHPMMWAFILWSVVHMVVWPTTANWLLSGSIAFLGFFGALGQDRRKARAMGIEWQGWQGRTAFLPFGLQLTGKAPWRDTVPSLGILVVGTLIWLGATWAHGIGAGVWRWV